MYYVKQRVKLIAFFYSSERSIIQTQKKRQHFNIRVSLSDNMTRKLNRPV